MATKKPPAKSSSKKSQNAGLLLFSNYSKLQLLAFGLIFAAIGSTVTYFVRAQTSTAWGSLVTTQSAGGCAINAYGVPYDIKTKAYSFKEGDISPCIRVVRYVLRTYAGASNLAVTNNFDAPTYTAVINVKKLFGVYNAYGVVDGWVDPNTWSVIQTIWTLGSKPAAPPAPVPPGGLVVPKPDTTPISGNVYASAIFATDWPKWNYAGSCIISHESYNAGFYTAKNPSSTASGAFQFLDTTWNGFMGYPTARSAPPAVQWVKFFTAYGGPGYQSPWRGTYWETPTGHLVYSGGSAVPCPGTY